MVEYESKKKFAPIPNTSSLYSESIDDKNHVDDDDIEKLGKVVEK